jgi:hypothetical protein
MTGSPTHIRASMYGDQALVRSPVAVDDRDPALEESIEVVALVALVEDHLPALRAPTGR